MKSASVLGAGGFIGGHLVSRLKNEGYWVLGVDVKTHEYVVSAADEFVKVYLLFLLVMQIHLQSYFMLIDLLLIP